MIFFSVRKRKIFSTGCNFKRWKMWDVKWCIANSFGVMPRNKNNNRSWEESIHFRAEITNLKKCWRFIELKCFIFLCFENSSFFYYMHKSIVEHKYYNNMYIECLWYLHIFDTANNSIHDMILNSWLLDSWILFMW